VELLLWIEESISLFWVETTVEIENIGMKKSTNGYIHIGEKPRR
jgi:hypothetical protein